MSTVTPPVRSGSILGLMLLAVVAGGLLAAYWFAHNGASANATDLPYDQFSRKLSDGQIYQDGKHPLDLFIEEGSSTQTLTGFYSDLPPAKEHLDHLQPFQTTISLDYDKDFKGRLTAKDLTPNIRNKSNVLATTLLSFLPIVLFLLIPLFILAAAVVAIRALVRWASARPPAPATPH